MNLNPLKKDDNTDALVKALEDANSGANQATPESQATSTPDPASGAQAPATATPATDPASVTPTVQDPATATDSAAVIASDPQVASAGVVTERSMMNEPTPTAPADSPEGVDETTSTDEEKPSGSPADSPVAFTGNDLPGGLSDDANAHLLGGDVELDGVKKSALEQLRPLIEKLDLEPTDKFDKYLMMLRASDDPALIKPAFEAAQGISGEKEKAQALLDIINEINYITASQQQSS